MERRDHIIEESTEHMADAQAGIGEEKEIAVNDWQKRHDALEAEREVIRSRVRNTRSVQGVLRPARPKPTISDDGEKSVGIYTRVSTTSTEQVSSIENQTLYYEKRVADEPQWRLHQIYSDEGKSGTSTKHRDAFNQMMIDAGNKDIDLILCASVSRFARNMSDCMNWVRQLKSMNPSHPVGVYFETENIYTLDPDSSKQLSVHAMLADWESANRSARMILSYDQRICTGQYPVVDLLGYRHTKDGQLLIEPEEAKTVRYIFLACLCGYDDKSIAAVLTEKGRSTLKGRTEWNAQMVRNIMGNERRWGDLEARKTIVIDYVDHKSKKNELDRISAYSEGHHEGIVTPAMARATKMCRASAHCADGISELRVITQGMLKGFVSVNPAWSGINHNTFMEITKGAYADEELNQIEENIRVWSGASPNKVLSMQMDGYEVPPGVYFLNKNMPSLTISKRFMKFNAACHTKMENCTHIEMLYHPMYQVLIVRESFADAPNSVCWNKSDGAAIQIISTPAFSNALYENMEWKHTYNFRFRGVTKVRGKQRFLLFALDEPQIILSKKEKEALGLSQPKETAKYIPYKEKERADMEYYAMRNYPEEWQNGFGMQYGLRKQREHVINAITEQDIAELGVMQVNPMIGQIPSRADILSELEELLMSM